MERLKQSIQDNPAYTKFSEANEEYLADLIISIKETIEDIQTQNSFAGLSYSRLLSAMEVSNAVFNTFRSREGLELVLRLRAISQKYDKNSEENAELLKVAGHIIQRLEKFNASLFHETDADEISAVEIEDDQIIPAPVVPHELKYRWITFERNGSFFISPFKKLEILDYTCVTLPETSSFEFIDYGSQKIAVIDLMRSPEAEHINPRRIIIIDSGKYCYAADNTGREIHSKNDILSPVLQPLESSNRLFSGRARFFGRRYLVLKTVP